MTPVQVGRLSWAAAAIVAVSVGIAAGPLPWRLAGESGLPAPDLPERPPEAAPVSLDPVLALMPFGRRAVPEAPADAPETGLGLVLHGVVIGARPASSSAIVSGEGAPARAYTVGQPVAGDMVLAEVHGDHIVLEADGRRETLSFPERSQAPGRRAAAAGSTGSGVDALRALVGAQSARAPESPTKPPADAADAADAAIATWRGRVQTNPRAVLDQFGLVPGEGGYTVAPQVSGATRDAGLRPGDVVAKVNGQQVGDIERDQQLFDEVVASGRARIELIREGQPVVLSFPLR